MIQPNPRFSEYNIFIKPKRVWYENNANDTAKPAVLPPMSNAIGNKNKTNI